MTRRHAPVHEWKVGKGYVDRGRPAPDYPEFVRWCERKCQQIKTEDIVWMPLANGAIIDGVFIEAQERRRFGFWSRFRRYAFDIGRAFLEQLFAILGVFPAFFVLIAALVGGGRRAAGMDFLRSPVHVLVRFDKLVGSIVLGTPWDLTISAWLGWQLEFRGGALVEWTSGFLHFLDDNHVQDAKAKAVRAGKFLDRHEWAGSIFFVLFLWTVGLLVVLL